jgi:hypothetical protein
LKAAGIAAPYDGAARRGAYADAKRLGVCPECLGAYAEPGAVRCHECLAKDRARAAARHQATVARNRMRYAERRAACARVTVGGREYVWQRGIGLPPAVALDMGGLATWAALRWRRVGALCGADMDDMRQACFVGILLAAREYVPGAKGFAAWAVWRMYGEMRRLCRRRPEHEPIEGCAHEPAVCPDHTEWENAQDARAVLRRVGLRAAAALRRKYGIGRPAEDCAVGGAVVTARAAIGITRCA